MVYHGSFSLFTKRGLWAIGGLVALGWAFVGNAAETTVSPAVRRSATHDRSVPTARPVRIAQVSPRGTPVLEVPNLVGRPLPQARQAAVAAAFGTAVRRRVAHRTAPRDTILAQDPPGGVKVRKGQIIRVTISAGSSRASGGAPDRAGRSLAQAPEAAAAAGSRLVARPGGTVVAQDPPPGAQVKRGQVIRVIILDADEGSTVSVPNLVGKTLAQARQATSSAGLQLAVTWPRVAVVEQRSPRGADFSKGEAVRVTVSPEGQRPSEVGRTTTQPLVEGAAAPLMIHVLGAYGRSSDAAVQHLRRGGWEFTEIAAAGYMARRAHPRRSLEEIAQAYETRRDWTALAEQFHALPPGDAEGILRLAVENYYILRAGTARELEARGWTLEEILVAGNLDHRSEAGFDEIVRLRNAGLDWPAIAARVRVPMEQLYQPHSRR